MIGNKVMNKIHVFIYLLAILLLGGCELEKVDYPSEPQIEFRSAIPSISENALHQPVLFIKLTFYLIDGDGDLGILWFDTTPPPPPYDANFFPTLYSIENNKLVIDTSLLATKYSIPYVNNLGQDKLLKAEVIVDLEYPPPYFPFPYDTIMYSFYMNDRALNKSNIAWTDTIILSELSY